ncbi:MAG: hypothetical protein N3I35_19560 [Clostridia bacterium]|nr:hypothetical protein [Clostridia bacterium]
MFSGEFGLLGIAGTILALGAAVLLLVVLIGICLYILAACGLYGMAQRRGIEFGWLAFIPVLQLYIVGKLLNRLRIFGIDIARPEFFLPAASLIVMIFDRVYFLGSLLGFANLIISIAALYYLYKMYRGKNKALLYTVLSIFPAFLLPIFLFNLRNSDPICDPYEK